MGERPPHGVKGLFRRRPFPEGNELKELTETLHSPSHADVERKRARWHHQGRMCQGDGRRLHRRLGVGHGLRPRGRGAAFRTLCFSGVTPVSPYAWALSAAFSGEDPVALEFCPLKTEFYI